MNDQCEPARTCMQVEAEPFDLWLAADLRQRFGQTERLPDDWLRLIETVPTRG